VGGLHGNVDVWKSILLGHPCSDRMLNWLTLKVDIRKFEQPFAIGAKSEEISDLMRIDRRVRGRVL